MTSSTPLTSDGDFFEQAAVEVEELEVKNAALKSTLEAMSERGISWVYGRWLIEGAPRVLLFDTKTGYGHLDEWKTDLWNVAMIPCPPGDGETNEAVVFGYLVAWFLGEVSSSSVKIWDVLNCHSLLVMRQIRPLLHTSTSGWQALLSHSAANAGLTSLRSLPHMQHF